MGVTKGRTYHWNTPVRTFNSASLSNSLLRVPYERSNRIPYNIDWAAFGQHLVENIARRFLGFIVLSDRERWFVCEYAGERTRDVNPFHDPFFRQ